MRLDIPFEYEVGFVRPRHRTPETRASGSCVTVEIPEARASDVRVVHRIATPHPIENETRRYPLFAGSDGNARAARIVEYEGRLYVEACRADEMEDLIAAHGMDAESGNGRDERSPFHVHPRLAPVRKDLTSISRFQDRARVPLDIEGLVEEYGGLRAGSLRDDGGKARAAAIEARAAEMIVFDGSVFVPTSEPVIVITRDYRDQGTVFLTLDEVRADGWSLFRRPTNTPLRDQMVEVFPLDRHADAVEYASRMAEAAGARFVDSARIDSFDPDRVALDGNWLTVRAARSILAAEGQSILDCHPEVAEAYADMRDALASHTGLCSPLLVKAADAYLRGVATHGLPGEPLAAACALMASGGTRDLSVEASAAPANVGLVQMIHAASAMSQAETAGRSWVRTAAVLDGPMIDEFGEASEITSVGEAERVAEGLGTPTRIRPANEGETLVAVMSRVGRHVVPQCLVRFDADMSVVESLGREGRQASPQSARLAHAQAMRCLHARSPASGGAVDEEDAAAFDF